MYFRGKNKSIFGFSSGPPQIINGRPLMIILHVFNPTPIFSEMAMFENKGMDIQIIRLQGGFKISDYPR